MQTPAGDMFKRLDAELFIARRLKELGKGVFDGITDPDERRERIRFAIINGAIDVSVIGRHPDSGRTETFAQAFERFYGEPLEPPLRKGKRA